jgi:hypothetical protein
MIAFDVDGITLMSHKLILQEINQVMGTELTEHDWGEYNIAEKIGMPEEDFVAAYRRVLELDTIPIQDGAVHAINNTYSKSRKPVLFITARAGKWLRAAERNIGRYIDINVPIKVINGNGNSDEDHDHTGSKLDILKENNVQFFMEDNPKYWEEYMRAGITVGTFPLPWCLKGIREIPHDIAYNLMVFNNWFEVDDFVRRMPQHWFE